MHGDFCVGLGLEVRCLSSKQMYVDEIVVAEARLRGKWVIRASVKK